MNSARDNFRYVSLPAAEGRSFSRRRFLTGALGGLAVLPGYVAAATWTPPAYRVVVRPGMLTVTPGYEVLMEIMVPKHGGGYIVITAQDLRVSKGAIAAAEMTANFILTTIQLRFKTKKVPVGFTAPVQDEYLYLNQKKNFVIGGPASSPPCKGVALAVADSSKSPTVVTITFGET